MSPCVDWAGLELAMKKAELEFMAALLLCLPSGGIPGDHTPDFSFPALFPEPQSTVKYVAFTSSEEV